MQNKKNQQTKTSQITPITLKLPKLKAERKQMQQFFPSLRTKEMKSDSSTMKKQILSTLSKKQFINFESDQKYRKQTIQMPEQNTVFQENPKLNRNNRSLILVSTYEKISMLEKKRIKMKTQSSDAMEKSGQSSASKFKKKDHSDRKAEINLPLLSNKAKKEQKMRSKSTDPLYTFNPNKIVSSKKDNNKINNKQTNE